MYVCMYVCMRVVYVYIVSLYVSVCCMCTYIYMCVCAYVIVMCVCVEGGGGSSHAPSNRHDSYRALDITRHLWIEFYNN